MIKIKNRDNLYFAGMDPWENALSAKKLARLKKSWAEIFRQHILSRMPITRVAKYYSKNMGRPTKELVSISAACVLQQIFDLTDDETVDQMAFNQQWHYALDLLNQDDQLLSLKTLWTMRHILTTDSLAKKVFNDATDRLIEVYKVDTSLQRLDSVHIHSNMARLGRVRLLARVCTKFLNNLKRQEPSLHESVSSALRTRYKKDEDSTYFGNPKPSESKKRLADIAQDIYELICQFKGHAAVNSLYSYKELERVFSEHCSVEDETVVVKPAKEIPSDSLQNPSDPDATYDGHKGQGYQVQIMETYSKETPACDMADRPDDKGSASLQLITYVDVEPAHCHDSHALQPALQDVKKRDLLPDELAADTLYGSQENKKKAQKHKVELIAPIPGKKPKHNLVDFEFDRQTDEVKRCPQGYAPQKIKHNKKGTLTAIWAKEVCGNCPIFSSCAVQKGKNGYRLRYNHKEVEASFRRSYEQSEDFKEKYRYRSGIEATNSRFIHMTGARRMRYRGLKRIDYAARLKALGINMFRAAKFMLMQAENPCYA